MAGGGRGEGGRGGGAAHVRVCRAFKRFLKRPKLKCQIHFLPVRLIAPIALDRVMHQSINMRCALPLPVVVVPRLSPCFLNAFGFMPNMAGDHDDRFKAFFEELRLKDDLIGQNVQEIDQKVEAIKMCGLEIVALRRKVGSQGERESEEQRTDIRYIYIGSF